MSEYIDEYELEDDLKIPGVTPQEYMERKFNDIYNRDYKSYLASIEWDTWCKHETPAETKARLAEIERKLHPFKHFF